MLYNILETRSRGTSIFASERRLRPSAFIGNSITCRERATERLPVQMEKYMNRLVMPLMDSARSLLNVSPVCFCDGLMLLKRWDWRRLTVKVKIFVLDFLYFFMDFFIEINERMYQLSNNKDHYIIVINIIVIFPYQNQNCIMNFSFPVCIAVDRFLFKFVQV